MEDQSREFALLILDFDRLSIANCPGCLHQMQPAGRWWPCGHCGLTRLVPGAATAYTNSCQIEQ